MNVNVSSMEEAPGSTLDLSDYQSWKVNDVQSWIGSLKASHQLDIDEETVYESLQRADMNGRDMEHWDNATLESLGINDADVQNRILNEIGRHRASISTRNSSLLSQRGSPQRGGNQYGGSFNVTPPEMDRIVDEHDDEDVYGPGPGSVSASHTRY